MCTVYTNDTVAALWLVEVRTRAISVRRVRFAQPGNDYEKTSAHAFDEFDCEEHFLSTVAGVRKLFVGRRADVTMSGRRSGKDAD